MSSFQTPRNASVPVKRRHGAATAAGDIVKPPAPEDAPRVPPGNAGAAGTALGPPGSVPHACRPRSLPVAEQPPAAGADPQPPG